MQEHKKYFEANRKLWDNKTPIHVNSEFYNMDGFLKGETSLRKIELEELSDVAGKKVLHTQCHFGQDSLSLQRMGAQVTAVDFSSAAIDKAKALNKQLGLNADFVCCNIYDLDKHVNEEFDLVFASYGVIAWLPDLSTWAKQISQRLRKGGEFLLVDFHPLLYMFDWDKDELRYQYFNSGQPEYDTEEGTYADKNADIKMEEYFWTHSLSELMQSLMENQMEILSYKEYDYSPYNIFPKPEKRGDQEFVFKYKDIKLPHVFALKVCKI